MSYIKRLSSSHYWSNVHFNWLIKSCIHSPTQNKTKTLNNNKIITLKRSFLCDFHSIIFWSYDHDNILAKSLDQYTWPSFKGRASTRSKYWSQKGFRQMPELSSSQNYVIGAKISHLKHLYIILYIILCLQK